MSEIYKIVLVGLDFAGKTSILKILEGSYSRLDQIKPTLGRERTEWDILGFKIINWDLGGQKQYRDEYLANKEQVLSGTNLLMYVVDVQDADRFEEAVNYFDNLLSALNELRIRCPILIAIHKLDPDIIYVPIVSEYLEKITDLFSECSQKHGVDINVFNTSIFDQKSLIEMFSYAIHQLIPVSILNKILDDFRQETNLVGAVLFDLNFFVIGDSFPDLTTRNTCYRTINAFTTLMRDFKGVYDDNREIDFNLPIKKGEIYKFQLTKITELTSPYYLIIMGSQFLDSKNAFSIFHTTYVPKIDKSLHELIKSIE